MPTWPPCFLSLVAPTELAFAVQQTLIAPSGLVLKCTQGRIQNVLLGSPLLSTFIALEFCDGSISISGCILNSCSSSLIITFDPLGHNL